MKDPKSEQKSEDKLETLAIVLGDQLFENSQLLDTCNTFLMVESMEEAGRLPYHKFRLAYQFTIMREYADYLMSKGKEVIYFELEQGYSFETALQEISKNQRTNPSFDNVSYYHPSDKFFSTNLYEVIIKLFNFEPTINENPNFLTSKDQFNQYLSQKTTAGLRMDNFYAYQRRRLGLLLTTDKKPVGGQWSFDEQNRQKLPKSVEVPPRNTAFVSKHYQQVALMVEKNFANKFTNNPGHLNRDTCWLPTNQSQAKQVLQEFLSTYFDNFGPYEDALTTKDPFVFHSVLSPVINHGLLNPADILTALQSHIKTKFGYDIFEPENLQNQLPPNLNMGSLEGFIRQIIGWREWVRGLYDTQYTEEVRNRNFFKATKPLPDYFWKLDRNHLDIIENLPLKLALEKLAVWSWNHHIERLMVLANWFTLNDYDPEECLRWFNAMYVDGFDWVMVPNVLGMGMFADGGLFASKPYIAGGNYIKKMSDYPNFSQWEQLWTDKFWDFLMANQAYFETQPRMAMLIKSRLNKEK